VGGFPCDSRYLIGDFNGDGSDDIARQDDFGRWFVINGSTGAPFPNPWWGYEIPGWPADGRYFVGDFDGDGADDIAYVSEAGRWHIVNGQDGSPRGGG
jgi:hypothetical protein